MTSLRIDFAPRSWRRAASRASLLSWVLLTAGVLLCAASIALIVHLDGSRKTVNKAIARLDRKLAEIEGRKPPPSTPVPEAQANAVNKAVMQLNLPWRDVLDAVEAATPGEVALLALEPDAKKRRLKGMAEAKNGESMLSYIEDLKRQHYFAEVVLTKHEVNDQDANRPYRFQFEAQWKEAGQ